MYENVLVGVNGLAGDQDAVALAKSLALDHHHLTLVHVRQIGGSRSRGSSSAFDLATSDLSRELVTRRAALAPDAEVVSVSATSVGEGLHQVAESRRADLIVVGSCHRSAAGRILAGVDGGRARPLQVGWLPDGKPDHEADRVRDRGGTQTEHHLTKA